MAEQDEQVLLTEIERNNTGISTQSVNQSDSGGAINQDDDQTVKTNDSNADVSGTGQIQSGQDLLQTAESGLDKVESLDQFEYIEPVPDPYNKAIKYLEQHSILQLFQQLTADIVYNRPPDPIDYMIAEIEEIKRNRDPNETEENAQVVPQQMSEDV
ncbi:uncharacterized protein LOC121370903 [Gigantopelta aegis]|uniref:uncharacterized protein LOC121370903 n=1 Tax=Gigantopelta aegis TaxID=1735272 RepID=UPI001B88A272|nr:uncharacterized protein LOC121370903 [Gigantopelta aegis]